MAKLICPFSAFLAALMLPAASVQAVELQEGAQFSVSPDRTGQRGDIRTALLLYDRGLFGKAREMFCTIAAADGDIDAEGYAVLCSLKMRLPGSRTDAENYLERYPEGMLCGQIRYADALNRFDDGEYAAAASAFADIKEKVLFRTQRPEYLFKKAHCAYECGDNSSALAQFKALSSMKRSDYTAPASYMAGYICYGMKDFSEAADWFGKSSGDSRFAPMSAYYLAECHFMMDDYGYLAEKGPELLDVVPEECLPKLNRLISESFLVLGNAEQARKYYDANAAQSAPSDRSDYFYAGSVLYAVKDYQGAIDNFSMMKDRSDSIGQVADYKLGYSYIMTRNKVSALDAFKAAAAAGYDKSIAEDAYFNYAKLSFDLNSDGSVFGKYLEKYPDSGKDEMIYGYMAVAALQKHDYAGAIEAYDHIDDLDPVMRSNYMKANYLRASELISSGSYRSAEPCLKAAAYYSDKRSMFNQMSRYWLAESYYRDDRFDDALDVYTQLYNISALYGMDESWLIPYGIAYCHFKKENYSAAASWFTKYLEGDKVKWRKDAMLRYADCLFMQKDYAGSAAAYDRILSSYPDADDIYPLYQASVAYGLSGNTGKKISLLENVRKSSPSAFFYPEALFELGRSYLTDGKDDQAMSVYKSLVEDVKDSTYVARALIELGMISRNRSDNDAALGYYKTVIEKMPLSGYADDALLAVESIYQSENDPQSYLDYIDKLGKSSLKTADEKEMMIFNAAEQIYLSENYQKALVALKSYLDSYPDGAKVPQAYFYMAECYRNTGKPEQACDFYTKVMDAGEGSYSELACLNYARLSYDLQRYDDAYNAYASLQEMASIENNRYAAKVGMMESAFRARNYDAAIACADDVLADSRTDSDTGRVAEYIKAKSCLATSRRDEAYAVFGKLAQNPGTPEGAEAAYLMILDCYDRGDFDQVETKVYAFSDSAEGQTYWLAKAFIVLGDSFVETGEYDQAMATFKSIRDGYSPSEEGDDIADNVKMRISKLEEIMQQDTAEN